MKNLFLLLSILVSVSLFSQEKENSSISEKEKTILKLVQEKKMTLEEAQILLSAEKKSKSAQEEESKTRISISLHGGGGSYGFKTVSDSSDSFSTLFPLLLLSSSSSTSSSRTSSSSTTSSSTSSNSLGLLLPLLLLSGSGESSETVSAATVNGSLSMYIIPNQGHSFKTGFSYGTVSGSSGTGGWGTLDLGYTYFFRDGKTFVPFLGIGAGIGSTTGGGGQNATVGKGYVETGFRVFFTESFFSSLTLSGEYLNFAYEGASAGVSGGNGQIGFGYVF